MTSRVTRVTILALIAAAVVALSGFPAQAQPYYYNYYGQPYYGPQPYYGATCQTYSYNGATYSNCPQQPYTYNQNPPYYQNPPYSSPYYTQYYFYGPYYTTDERER